MTTLRLVGCFFATFCVCGIALSNEKTLTLTICDESGSPIPKAKFSYWGDPKPHDADGYRKYTETDENGQFVVAFKPEQTQKSLVFILESPGYAPFHAGWGDRDANIENDPIPAEYSVKLEKALTVGGIVLGDDGKPLAGVNIDFSVPWGNRARIKQPDHYVCGCRAKTDENGIWKYESVPSDLLGANVGFSGISFEHPDYMRVQKVLKFSDLVPSADGTFTQSVQLEQGITVKGRVTDTDGRPVVGAVVVGRNVSSGGAGNVVDTTTDENGEYSLKNWNESRDAYVGVWKTGMMAILKNLPVVEKANPPVIDFTLKPAGKPITIKIIDKEGKPVKGFFVAVSRWQDQRNTATALLTGKNAFVDRRDERPRTDENGIWTWREAPDEAVMLDMFSSADGYMNMRNQPVVARDEEYVFTAISALKISGSVIDAETGEAIPKFNVYFGRTQSDGKMYWNIERGAATAGAYSVGTVEEVVAGPCAVKIESLDYEPAISRNISYSEEHITIDFALSKLSSDKAVIHGTVLQPNGTPAGEVGIAMVTLNRSWLDIQNGRLGGEEPYTISADKDGKFKFAYIDFEEESKGRFHGQPGRLKVDYLLFFLHDSGFKRLTQQEWKSLDENKIVTLEPWGRIEGTVKIGTQPGKNLPVQCRLSFDDERRVYGSEPYVHLQYETTADESGRFSWDRVPASFVRVARTIRFNDTGRGYTSMGSHSVGKIELKPGGTVTVALGGVGRPITGKLVPSAEFEAVPDWVFAHIQCSPVLEKVDYPDLTELQEKMVPEGYFEGTDRSKLFAWLETEDGKKYQAAVDELTKDAKAAQERNDAKQARQRVCAVAKDGTFRLDDMPEGDWQLTIQLDAPPPSMDQCGTGGRIGMLTHEFSVAAIPGGVSDESLDIGTLEVKRLAEQKPMPQVGEAAPDFEIPKIEPLAADAKYEDKGEKLRLSDYKGKYVVLDFWAMWCGPCLAKLPELKTLYEKYKDDERFVMIGVSLDGAKSEERLAKFVAQREMPWLQGLAGDWDGAAARSYGVQAIPAMFLIGPDGNVLLSNPSITELTKRITEE